MFFLKLNITTTFANSLGKLFLTRSLMKSFGFLQFWFCYIANKTKIGKWWAVF